MDFLHQADIRDKRKQLWLDPKRDGNAEANVVVA